MTVYFLNRNSKIKGPFDIIDSNREHIIKVGDVCLRDTHRGVEFLVVYTPNNTWGSCKCVGIGTNNQFEDDGNTLVFTFDGIHRRQGDTLFLSQLISCFREKVIVDFLQNAIDILQYRSDCWDGSLFPQFFASEQVYIISKNVETEGHLKKSAPYPSAFSEYLNESLLNTLRTYLEEGDNLKDAYLKIRQKYPEQFRKAFINFLLENPHGTIFDTPPVFEKRESEVVETNTDVVLDNSDAAEIELKEQTSTNCENTNEYLHFLLNDFDRKEFDRLLKKYHNGDAEALDKIVKSNIKLVTALVNSYKDQGLEYNDLVQEGTIGLIKAVDRFNPRRKVLFPEYAKWWIHLAIAKALNTEGTTIRIPSNQFALYKKVRKCIERYEQEFGYEPSPYEIDIEGYDDLQNIELLCKMPDSLDKLTVNTVDLDEFPTADSATDDFIAKEARSQFIDAVLNKLSTREARILRLKYGIGEKIETLGEIGSRFGLTRERARQISEKAVSKLREIIHGSGNDSANCSTQDDQEEIYRLDESAPKKTKSRKESDTRPVFVPKTVSFPSKKYVEKMLVPNRIEIGGAEVGDIIMYHSKICEVLEKKCTNDSSRLVVKYDNNMVDNLLDEKGKYRILLRADEVKSHNHC